MVAARTGPAGACMRGSVLAAKIEALVRGPATMATERTPGMGTAAAKRSENNLTKYLPDTTAPHQPVGSSFAWVVHPYLIVEVRGKRPGGEVIGRELIDRGDEYLAIYTVNGDGLMGGKDSIFVAGRIRR